ncbi:MAG: PspC domain-containing protein, partial [Rikenellaceae bacterium]|nr:PspC domain-containing protein [Rikenellaceae bacterium]
MKESKKVSISGVGFVFDFDAYEVLAGYLDNLNQTYKDTADGEEIVADIEARIAELILSRQSNMTVVSLPLIRSIIDQMGSPEAIEEESNEGEPKAKEPTPRIPRRLYRNPESAKLGGVCSGIGTFFDIDPVWVRLAMFAPLVFLILSGTFHFNRLSEFCSSIFGIFILGYFVMWFAIPMAKSARQKLEMTGEKINAQTISSKTRAQAEMNDAVSNDERGQSLLADIFYVIGRIVLFFFKAAALLTLTAILAGVIACIVGLFAFLFTAPDNDYEMFHSFMTYIGSATVITL